MFLVRHLFVLGVLLANLQTIQNAHSLSFEKSLCTYKTIPSISEATKTTCKDRQEPCLAHIVYVNQTIATQNFMFLPEKDIAAEKKINPSFNKTIRMDCESMIESYSTAQTKTTEANIKANEANQKLSQKTNANSSSTILAESASLHEKANQSYKQCREYAQAAIKGIDELHKDIVSNTTNALNTLLKLGIKVEPTKNEQLAFKESLESKRKTINQAMLECGSNSTQSQEVADTTKKASSNLKKYLIGGAVVAGVGALGYLGYKALTGDKDKNEAAAPQTPTTLSSTDNSNSSSQPLTLSLPLGCNISCPAGFVAKSDCKCHSSSSDSSSTSNTSSLSSTSNSEDSSIPSTSETPSPVESLSTAGSETTSPESGRNLASNSSNTDRISSLSSELNKQNPVESAASKYKSPFWNYKGVKEKPEKPEEDKPADTDLQALPVSLQDCKRFPKHPTCVRRLQIQSSDKRFLK